MVQPKVKIVNLSKFPNPKRQSKGSSGYDLYANLKEPLVLKAGEFTLIPTGIYLEIPEGLEAQVRARSGLAAKHGLSLVNGIGTIDSDYRGEVRVIMINLSNQAYTISPGERIAQLVFVPVVFPDIIFSEETNSLEQTERADGGFGHSGKN